ncbi:baseplate multidomain protein megatron [Anianabacter salinae]|uniref:baseplate multidomain protein megatron n=1 Tax=Anianabacter salinae TaxID=2851023 RepID=UPI00225E44E8|nr:glycoside hydrolase/phage tail family protein [Anianabacter salinae]MBV0912953.1 glycoside hydrolase/phage tail family protein [Anianabacter salinae]
MATIVLSAVGGALGSALGGSVLGLSTAVLGRAVGATLGRWIDQQVMGGGSEAVETGRIERFRINGASEGAPIARAYGRVRLGGQVIWATRFREHASTTTQTTGGGGKGGGPRNTVTTTRYAYSVSLAVAVCEGPIAGIGRLWADGQEIDPEEIGARVYTGAEDQLPDPKIEAVQGAGQAPAYRGIAYVVFEDLMLERFGNRVPQFSFEVLRPAPEQAGGVAELSHAVRGVALIPGTGEYALATTPVYYDHGYGLRQAANLNASALRTDISVSLDALTAELPNCGSVSLVVSWFGSDLRAGQCTIQPKVEHHDADGDVMPWSVSGLARAGAQEVPRIDGKPVYGGTPTDRAVIEALRAISARGKGAVFYPFILMDQLAGNALADPYGGGEQAALPWRGRITTGKAPGQAGSSDGTAAAEAEVAAFFGSAVPGHFAATAHGVAYSGPAEWSYRRFILHQAHLCAVAGGVTAFCIGSEMRGLTQIRGAGDSFPAVAALRALAADVRAILGPDVKIGYAADWSEYFGYQPQDGSGNVYFHLDPLWSDPNIDFIGIDNYMPLADWRDTPDHADAGWESIYDLGYLQANIEGGEGFDWYYASDAARDLQDRTPITDGGYDEPWVWRYKDVRGWWSNAHHERRGWVRQETPTAWVPGSKPIWFTEIGCAAIDKGANQPNRFLDPKSSESGLPLYSNGQRDDLMQIQALRAICDYWSDPAKNPVSDVYGGAMIDVARTHVWAWDARPFPQFPGNLALWSDGDNYLRGHWLNGRSVARALDGLVAELANEAGLDGLDTARLYGLVRGYTVSDPGTVRAALQPLMLAFGFDAVERDGVLRLRSRGGGVDAVIDTERLVEVPKTDGVLELTRAPEAELAGRLRLVFAEADGAFNARSEEAVLPDESSHAVAQTEVPLVLTRAEARRIVERWLAEARIARSSARFALPPSAFGIGAGDIVSLPSDAGPVSYRIDRVERAEAQTVEAVRVDAAAHDAPALLEETPVPVTFAAPQPVQVLFLDLPLLRGDEVAHAPHIAATAEVWPGQVAVMASAGGESFALDTVLDAAATMGVTETALARAEAGLFDRGPALRVRLFSGALASAGLDEVLNGANVAAIGDGQGAWEVFQFADAELVAPHTFDLSLRLRGQAGTDGVMPDVWSAGSRFVLLDGAVRQIGLAAADRGIARRYRIGPARLGYDHPAYSELSAAFDGVGLRPYTPAHLRAVQRADGGVDITWLRRTRIDGDSWASYEVPLGEDREAYALRIEQGGVTLREAVLDAPRWTYTSADISADGVAGALTLSVAQISDRFGPGPTRRMTFHV